jgi:predicted glycosyltransferase
LLVTPGGGGDGVQMIESVLGAYEHFHRDLPPAVFVLGPFMAAARRNEYERRLSALPSCESLVFDARMERRTAAAAAVAAMGGYNTFCEILSFDKPALLMPRHTPRMEQTIRARRASALGLSTSLELPGDNPAEPAAVAAALLRLKDQPPPSAAGIPGLLDGLDSIVRMVRPWLDELGLAA